MDDEPKLGSPWSILPIKNNKYARDLTEVHLSGRNLTGLEHFEQFPNLEEIWLSNNRVSFILYLINFSLNSLKTLMTSNQISVAKKLYARAIYLKT